MDSFVFVLFLSLPAIIYSASFTDGVLTVNLEYLSHGAALDDEIKITMTITDYTSAEDNGWFAIGLSNNEFMIQTDVIVAWRSADGTPTVSDRWASEKKSPEEDGNQDVSLVSHSQTNGVVTMVMKRKATTTDSKDYSFYSASNCPWIFLARGQLIGANMLQHYSIPIKYESQCIAATTGFSVWSQWTSCTKTCGDDSQTRRRTCSAGGTCTVDDVETKACNLAACSVFDQWTDWSDCSISCGGDGTSTRSRTCSTGTGCTGEPVETVKCTRGPCPVDGVWGDWGDDGSCSVNCGGGSLSQTRTCIGPMYGGKVCVGDPTQNIDCNTQSCPVPVDGVWGNWGIYGACSVTCDGGSSVRTRTCNGRAYGGKACVGIDRQTTMGCNPEPCPDQGDYTAWDKWTNCTKPCNVGEQTRTRSCKVSSCPESLRIRQNCNSISCSDWADWMAWDACSRTCGGGSHKRSRRCGTGVSTDVCIGLAGETEACNTENCPETTTTQTTPGGRKEYNFNGRFDYLTKTDKIILIVVSVVAGLLIFGGFLYCTHNKMKSTDAHDRETYA